MFCGTFPRACAPTQGPIRTSCIYRWSRWAQSDTGAAGPPSSAVTMTTLDWFRTWESGAGWGAFHHKQRFFLSLSLVFTQRYNILKAPPLPNFQLMVNTLNWGGGKQQKKKEKRATQPECSSPAVRASKSATSPPHHIAPRRHNISYNSTEWPYSSMQLRSLRRTFFGGGERAQLKFWIRPNSCTCCITKWLASILCLLSIRERGNDNTTAPKI